MKAMSFSRCLRFVAAALVVAWVGAAKLQASVFDEKCIIPEPGGAAIELKAAKKTYYLGEPFLIEFILKNTGKKQISFSTDGDYLNTNRNLARAFRFRVQAIDEKGKVVPTPTGENSFSGGGAFGGPKHILPGEEWKHELCPLDYMELTKPGKYTFRMTHDFGWNGDEGHWMHNFPSSQPKKEWLPKGWLTPIGELQVEFVLPDKKQAEEVIEQISEAIKKSGQKKIPGVRDLVLPEFLAPMRKHAEQGEVFFIEAIGKILTKESTLALIEMAESKDAKVSQAAGIVLGTYVAETSRNRFSSKNAKALEEYYKRAKWSLDGFKKDVQEKTTKSEKLMAAWDDSFAPRVRAIARRLVAKIDESQVENKGNVVPGQMSPDFREVELGAQMLGFLGDVKDYEILRDALSVALDKDRTEEAKDGMNAWYLPSPIPTLVQALDVFPRDEKKLEKVSLNDTVALFLAFHWKDLKNLPEPKEWLKTINSNLGDSAKSLVWRVAVEAVPMPLREESRRFVIESLDSKDPGVVYSSCRLILETKAELFSAKDKEELYREALLIVRTENSRHVFGSAVDAVKRFGSKKELAEVLADRLLDEKMLPDAGEISHEALSELCELFIDESKDGAGRSGSINLPRQERAVIQEAWKKWIKDHAQDLEKGVKFKIKDDKNLPKELFGRGTCWHLKSGERWPEQPEK